MLLLRERYGKHQLRTLIIHLVHLTKSNISVLYRERKTKKANGSLKQVIIKKSDDAKNVEVLYADGKWYKG